ncbi:hypothetical protein GCM10020331_031550 [Ectobacillus funiculus]
MVQLKGMLQSPYLHAQYIAEVLYAFPTEPYFADRYAKEVESWLAHALYKPSIVPMPAAAQFLVNYHESKGIVVLRPQI